MPAAAFLFLALCAGAMLPLQAVFNARLGTALGSPVFAAATSALVSAVMLFLVGLGLAGAMPRTGGLQALPVWAWIGGICGVVTLAGVTACTPRLGAATTVALVVAGQVVFALLLDRFGLFGLPAQPITPHRALAALLLLSGAFLIR